MTAVNWSDFTPVDAEPAAESGSVDWSKFEPIQPAGPARKLSDIGASFAGGAVGATKAIADAGGAGNAVSQRLDGAQDVVQGWLSPARQAEKTARAQIISEAEKSGSTLREIGAHLGAFAEAPVSTVAEAAGSVVPVVGAMLTPAGRSAAARTLLGIGLGAAQGAGSVKGSIYDAVQQKHIEQSATPEVARQAAEQAQAYTGPNTGSIAVGAGLGVVAGTSGVEGVVSRAIAGKAAAGGASMVRRSAVGAVAEGLPEALQGGQERLATNQALQQQGFDVPTWQGVAGQAAAEGLAGGVLGGGMNAASRGHARLDAAQTAPINADDPSVGEDAAAPSAPAQAAPVIDPTAGPVSKAASKVEGLALAPQELAAATPTAAPQPSLTELAAQVENLPTDVRRDARFTLTELQRQDLPPGVRAFHESQLRSLMGEPVPEVAPVDQQPVGELVRPFDARQSTYGTPAWLARYQDEQWQDEQYPERAAALDRLPQEYQLASSYFRDGQWDALKEHFHATGGPRQNEAALDAAFATLMSKDRAVAPDARVEALRVINDSLDDELGDFGTDQQIDAAQPHLTLVPKQPAQYEGGIDFEAAPRGTRARTGPAPDADVQTIARLALTENIEPGQPLQLNRAHALRRAAAAKGIAMTVVPHASGRGYDVAPTARLDSAARAAMPQGEATAMLPFDQSATGRMVAGTDGRVRAEAKPEAVARNNTAAAQRQQVEAERQRRTDLGLSNITPVRPVAPAQSASPNTDTAAAPALRYDTAPTGRMVAGADGVRREVQADRINREQDARDAQPTATAVQENSSGPQTQQTAPQREEVPAAPAPTTVVERHPNWRKNAMQAGKVARSLGLDPKGKRLAQVVADIDAHDLQQNQPADQQKQAQEAINSEAKSNAPASAMDMRSAELAADEAQNGPYPHGAAVRNGEGRWTPAVKVGMGGRAITDAPAFSDAGAAASWSRYEQAKGRQGADAQALQRLQDRVQGRVDVAPAPADSPAIESKSAPPNASMKYVPAAKVDTPAQGVLNSAQTRKAQALQRLKTVHQQVQDGTANRLQLIKAESAHKDSVREVDAARAQIKADANRQGLTTLKAQDAASDGALFSARSASPESSLSLEKVQEVVQQALSGLRNPPPVDVVMRGSEIGVAAPDGVMGAAIPGEGRIVIVASAHGSADAVVETLFHEMFHLGLRNVLPAQDYAQAMLDLAKRDSRVQEYANKWKKEAPDAPLQLQALRDQGHTGSQLTLHYEALAIEEGLAVVAEELRAQKQAGTRLGLRIRALAGWLANVAEKMGMARLASSIRKMTYNEAERFVLAAIENAGRASVGPGGVDGPRFRANDQTQTPEFKRWFEDSKVVGADGQPLKVYHGTANDFSVFSHAEAGKNVNTPASRTGFFFTDRPDIAQRYSEMRKGTQQTMPVYLSMQNPTRASFSNMMEADRWLAKGYAGDGAIIEVTTPQGRRSTVYAVKNATQIKSATGNNGAFDPGNADIRYRTEGAAARVGEAIKGVTLTNLKQQAGFKATDYMGLGLQLLGRRQLVDVYGKLLPQLSTYNGLMAQMDADKNEAGAGADELATAWGKLPDERALAELMHDATLEQIDPAKEFVPGDNRTQWGALNRRYEALSPAAKDVYARARDTYSDHTSEVRKAIKERIERSGMGGERKDALLQRMDDELFGRIKGVYFPLARFGQYLVVVKDAEGKTVNVSRAETMAEADAARQQLQTPFPASKGFTVGKVLKAKEFIADRDAVGRGFMEQLYGVLDKQNMDGKQKAELEDALGQLYLSAMPDLSWAKHGIHRKGTPGFSQDARRAFAQNVFHGARYLAKLRYSDLLQDELNAMDKHVSARDSDAAYDSVRGRQVVDEMNKRHDAAMNPQGNPLSTALTSAGFVFYLGLSPASAMVNLSQTALVAYPVMAAKWGYAKSAAALLTASKQAAVNRNDISGALNADEKSAYDEAVRAGVIDVTMAHDLAGIAQGEDSGVMWKVRPVMKWASFLFHHAEKFNRQVTFVAAYRLAREGGANATEAYADAAKATYDGHFDYSSNNRPRVMQGNAARVLLLFKQFGQNMVYTVARQAQQSLKGASPKERAEARKALGGLLAMHGMAAGVLGLPMVTTLLAAASMLGGDDDEPWDAQVAMQNMLADAFGQKPAEVLAHGLSRLTPWDISGRVGLDRLILPDLQEGLEGQRLGESAMAAALGPVAGIGINALKGLQDMGNGHYQRGLESMLPTVLRGPLKALRYGMEGVRDKSGIVVADEVDAAALFGQAVGFSPSEVRNAFEGKSAIVQHDRALQARRSTLVEQFAMAAMAGDEEGKVDARESIARFNEKNPDRRILPMQLAQSVRMRTKRIEQAQDGVYLPSKRRDALEAGRFATGQ